MGGRKRRSEEKRLDEMGRTIRVELTMTTRWT
jgi:hypothetical protein